MNEFDVLADKLNQQDADISAAARQAGDNRTACRGKWTTPTLQNSWANYGGSFDTAGYALDNDDTVHLKGLIKTGASGSTAFTLPTTLRPVGDRWLVAAASGGPCVVIVGSNGTVAPYNKGGNVSTWVSLHGLRFTRQVYGDQVMPMGIGTRNAIHDASWPPPMTRKHLGGFVFSKGFEKMTSSPSSGEIIDRVSSSHSPVWMFIYYSLADDALCRLDVGRGAVQWLAGAAGTTWICQEGKAWPSAELEAGRVTATRAGGVSVWGGNGMFNKEPYVYTDTMGMKFIGMLVTPSAFTNGTALATVPVGSRPSKDIILPALSNNVATSVILKSSGSLELNENGDAGWVSVAHPYWIDN